VPPADTQMHVAPELPRAGVLDAPGLAARVGLARPLESALTDGCRAVAPTLHAASRVHAATARLATGPRRAPLPQLFGICSE